MTKLYCATALMALLLSAPILKAQDYKVPASANATVTLESFPGEIPIEGYNGSEIVISGAQTITPPERAKGLKPIYPGGTDNTGLGIAMEKSGDNITLVYLLPITQDRREFKINVPENVYLKIKSGCERDANVSISNIKGEVDVNICGDIKLKNVSGPLVLSTISGNITVAFTEVRKDKPISIANISGEIDVTIPASTPASIEMSTISGTMYSDFDFHTDDKNMRRIGGNRVNADINGGGVDIKLHNISGSIFLRKG
jgi:lia operon protein LiaG